MADVQYWEQCYRDRLEALESILLTADTIPAHQLQDALVSIQEKHRGLQNARKSFQLDMRSLAAHQQALFMTKFKEFEPRFKAVSQDIKALENKATEAFSRDPDAGGSRNQGWDNATYLTKTEEKHQEIGDSLNRTINIIADTNEVAEATGLELQRQRKQLEEIRGTLLTLEGTIGHAGRLLQDFKKRMMTDKCIRVFFILNGFMLIAVIAYWIATKDKKDDSGGNRGDPGSDDVAL